MLRGIFTTKWCDGPVQEAFGRLACDRAGIGTELVGTEVPGGRGMPARGASLLATLRTEGRQFQVASESGMFSLDPFRWASQKQLSFSGPASLSRSHGV